MINQRLILASLLFVAVFVGLFLFLPPAVEENKVDPPSQNNSPTPPPAQDVKREGRKVINLPAEKKDPTAEKFKMQNTVSSVWKEELQKTLRIQGGKKLKDASIEVLNSFIWAHEGTALYVESVLITLTDHNGEKTKFKAMIDSSNGKILQTWDRPVIDPINPRERTGIKLDPRYHND